MYIQYIAKYYTHIIYIYNLSGSVEVKSGHSIIMA